MILKEIENLYATAEALRADLHGIPEKSGCEHRTGEYLKRTLGKDPNGRDRLTDHGKWFYLLHEEDKAAETVGFRADMDAVTGPDGKPYHGCGHDGHSSVMAALALWAKGKTFGKNLVFLFQHGEETGEGAKECLPLFDEVRPDRFFAFHNIPGFAEGTVLEREGTFACASKGLSVSILGKQSHAAYPELGKNPVYPLGGLIGELPDITDPGKYRGMTLLTPVYLNAGTKAFGVAAGEGEISFTIRAWYDEDLKLLEQQIRETAEKLSRETGMKAAFSECDVFYATETDPEALDKVRAACRTAGIKELQLSEPMRWSEDFGRFGVGTKTCMVGIGAGENAPGLHTPEYRWNPQVSRTALMLFSEIIRQ